MLLCGQAEKVHLIIISYNLLSDIPAYYQLFTTKQATWDYRDKSPANTIVQRRMRMNKTTEVTVVKSNSTPNEVNANREYKSDVFKMYFSIKKNILDLYNAMNGTSYTEDDDVEVNTLDQSIFLKIYNDVSFVLSGTINLYEHQSTINPNMPLRDLFYISDMYKPYGMTKDLYSKTVIKIPTPKFVVFYNGRSDAPESEILKLSDAFIQSTGDPELELKVKVLNINYGHNKELMEKCVALRDYAILNQRIRDNLDSGMNIEAAATNAVDTCIRDHIMEDFLIKEKAGVISMHVLDFNEELHNESLKEEGKQERDRERIANMLNRGKTPEAIAEFCDYPMELIKEVQESMVTI